jgi:hypothetical protein
MRCNRIDGAKVVTPMIAALKRKYKFHRDMTVSRHPVPGGTQDPWMRTWDGRVLDRRTGEPWSKRIDDKIISKGKTDDA